MNMLEINKLVYNRIEYLEEISKLIPENSICIELGVEKGEFSEGILKIINPKKLFLVDPWEIGHDKNGSKTYGETLSFEKTSYSTEKEFINIKNKFSEQIKNNQVSIVRNFSYDAVEIFNDNFFDFVYIDACHLYECVKEDLSLYLPKLKENGLMCGHDYFNFDNFGVVKAVDEFCVKHNYEMIIFNENHYFDWALRKK